MAASMEEPQAPPVIRIFVDADACPVKPEIYRVAERYGLKVYVVANAFMAVPRSELIERVIVAEGPDAADDWIAERATEFDIVITADIPLAARLVPAGVVVIDPRGEVLDEENVGERLSVRDFMSEMRDAGVTTGGPRPYGARDKQRFASALDAALQRAMRGR
jgi:uncharacterized protein